MAAGKTIASGSAILTTSADGLKSGLESAQKQLQQFGAKAQTSLNPAAAQGGSGSFASRLLGGLAGGLKAGVIGIAVGTATAFGAEMLNAFDRLESINKLAKRAKSIGISGSQFQGLTKQFEKFGMEAGDVSVVLEKFGAKVTDAGLGAPQASAAFERLGLSAADLAKLPLDQQFLRTADAIAKLDSPAKQAHAAIAIFGKQGVNLLPILQKGGKGIQEFIEKQKAMGAVLGDDQFAAAARAAEAWKKSKETIKASFEGILNQAALIAAPFIEKIASFGQKILKFIMPVIDWFQRLWSTEGVLVVAVLEEIGKFAEGIVGWFQQMISQVPAFSGEWPSVQEVLVKVFRVIGTAGAYVWDTLAAGVGIFAVGLGKIIGLLGTVADMFKDTLKDLALLGASVADALGFKDTAAKFRTVANFAADLGRSVKEAGQDMQTWGWAQFDAWGSGPKQFNTWLDKLLAPKDVKAAGEDAGKEFSEGMSEGFEKTKFAAAMHKNSKEAYSTVISNQFREQAQTGDHLKDIKGHVKRGADASKEGAKHTKEVKDILAAVEAV